MVGNGQVRTHHAILGTVEMPSFQSRPPGLVIILRLYYVRELSSLKNLPDCQEPDWLSDCERSRTSPKTRGGYEPCLVSPFVHQRTVEVSDRTRTKVILVCLTLNDNIRTIHSKGYINTSIHSVLTCPLNFVATFREESY